MPSFSINLTTPSIPRIDLQSLKAAGFDALTADIQMSNPPQGELVNIEHYQALANAIANCVSCQQLNLVANQAVKEIEAQIENLLAQADMLKPLLDLFNIGKDPLGWIVRFVNTFLSQYMGPYFQALAEAEQLVQIASQIASAVENAAKNLEDCNISVNIVAP